MRAHFAIRGKVGKEARLTNVEFEEVKKGKSDERARRMRESGAKVAISAPIGRTKASFAKW